MTKDCSKASASPCPMRMWFAPVSLATVLFASACSAPAQPSGGSAVTAPTAAPAAAAQASPAVVVSAQASPGAAVKKWSFDQDQAGAAPTGAQVFSGTWAVRAEADAPSQPNALCQTGKADFPALMLDASPARDVILKTRFKAISGSEDRAAGLIVRIQDKGNYSILRANALEDNVNLYLYVDGRRSGLKDGRAKVPAGQWQDLRLEVRGDSLRGFLNDQAVVEASDGTFKSAGGIGLWTKADSQTCFDDVEVNVIAS